jgi:hypothetical protein
VFAFTAKFGAEHSSGNLRSSLQRKTTLRFLQITVLTLIAISFGLCGPCLVSAQSPSTASGEAIYKALTGHWTGYLEYRDYSNDKRVKLPTVLDVTPTGDAQAVEMKYVYDDGPGKIVKEAETILIDLSGRQYTVQENDGKKTVYQITQLEGFGSVAEGSLLLSGPGIENDKAVEVRTTIRCTESSLTILRETRLPGGEFKFRHQYAFTRAAPTTTPQ